MSGNKPDEEVSPSWEGAMISSFIQCQGWSQGSAATSYGQCENVEILEFCELHGRLWPGQSEEAGEWTEASERRRVDAVNQGGTPHLRRELLAVCSVSGVYAYVDSKTQGYLVF